MAYHRVNESELEIEGVNRPAYKVEHSPSVELMPAAGNRAAFYVRPILPVNAVGG